MVAFAPDPAENQALLRQEAAILMAWLSHAIRENDPPEAPQAIARMTKAGVPLDVALRRVIVLMAQLVRGTDLTKPEEIRAVVLAALIALPDDPSPTVPASDSIRGRRPAR